jgi:hypothetical protein
MSQRSENEEKDELVSEEEEVISVRRLIRLTGHKVITICLGQDACAEPTTGIIALQEKARET